MAYWDESYWTGEESRLELLYPLEVRDRNELEQQGLKIAKGRPSHVIDRLGPFVIDKSSESHRGPFACAIDFLVPMGSIVKSVANGVVTDVVDHNTNGGSGEEFAPYMNYVTIMHEHGEYSQYAHLARGFGEKFAIHVGTQVRTGNPIGEVGMTGWTDRPHLHFIVFRTDSRPTHGTHHHSMADLDGISQMARDWPSSKYPFKSLRVRFA